MERCLKIGLLILNALALVACNRHGLPLGSTSSISIRAPAHILAAIPTGRTACFGVNVTGSGISSATANSCSPMTGIVAGYLTSGQDINVTVPANIVINVDLYLYLVPAGRSACPTMAPSFAPSLNQDTYLLGSATNILTGQAVTNVNITANYPASGQNIVQQMGMPATCAVAQAGGAPSPFTMSSGGIQNLTGPGIKLNARAGETYGSSVLTGSGVKLIVR